MFHVKHMQLKMKIAKFYVSCEIIRTEKIES